MLQRLWPLPALLAWLLAWGLCVALRQAAVAPWLTVVAPALLGLGLAAWPTWAATRWRAVMVAVGFPVSAWALHAVGPQGAASGLPGWVWLLLLGVLLLAYPMHAWRDAPVYPTPDGALNDLPSRAPLPPGARILDAGCGLGHGLRALHGAYPQARIEGIEWSWPLSVLCRRRCPWAFVQRGDMWAQDWSTFDMVYVFQRPESMPRVWDKARREMKPGAWLVSLAFEVPGVTPVARLGPAAADSPRCVRVYCPRDGQQKAR